MSKQTDAMRRYFEAQGMKYRDVAEAVGMSAPALSNLLSDRETIGKSRAKRFSEVFGFNYLFLLTGEGSLLSQPSVTQSMSANVNNGSMTQNNSPRCPDVSELVKRIEELTSELESKRKENEWLRSIVDRLVPDSK